MAKKRSVGRPPITEYLSEERIAKAYEVTGSARAAAKKLGTTHRTVVKYLRKMGYEVNNPHEWVYTEPRVVKKYSKFAKWLRDNQGIALPRSIIRLSEMAGCSYHTVNCYMYRRRKKVRDELTSLPDLIESGVLVKVKNHPERTTINTRSLKEYRYEVDHYDLSSKVVASDGKYGNLIIEIPDREVFIAAVIDNWKLSQ